MGTMGTLNPIHPKFPIILIFLIMGNAGFVSHQPYLSQVSVLGSVLDSFS